jgi:hypothetical protein
MSRVVLVALMLGCLVAAPPGLHAQSQSDQSQDPSQSKPAPAAPKPGNTAPKAGGQSNPFPTETNTVPVLPSATSPGTPVPDENIPAYSNVPLPSDIADPVRSPDDPVASAAASSGSSSSDSSSGLDELLKPPPDTGKHKSQADAGPPEGPKVDENVGSYYLESHDWKGALSRFESALVLDPENPDVYWGLAEAQRHMGDYANAKANYVKVMEYDPDSKHAKDAKRILKQPEIANAPAVSSNAAAPAAQSQQQ